jgi:hypothetical protein
VRPGVTASVVAIESNTLAGSAQPGTPAAQP